MKKTRKKTTKRGKTNDSTIHQRVGIILDHYGITAYRLAKNIGVTQPTIVRIVDGQFKPGYDVLCGIHKTLPEIDLHWLLTGEDDMIVNKK